MPGSAFLSIFLFKGFLKYINGKRRSKENIGPIFIEDGHLENRDEEKAKAFDGFFFSPSVINNRPWVPGSLSWRTTSARTVTFHLGTLKL